MPQTWHDSIDAHRGALRDATLDAVGALVAERGLPSITMSGIAERAGIGRATLYKYFSDVDAVVSAWHERQVAAHFHALTEVSKQPGAPGDRLRAVLQAYTQLARHSDSGTEFTASLHRSEDVARHQHRVRALVATLITEGAQTGELRSDVPASELATFCLHALTAASAATSQDALDRLLEVTLDGLLNRRPHETGAST